MWRHHPTGDVVIVVTTLDGLQPRWRSEEDREPSSCLAEIALVSTPNMRGISAECCGNIATCEGQDGVDDVGFLRSSASSSCCRRGESSTFSRVVRQLFGLKGS